MQGQELDRESVLKRVEELQGMHTPKTLMNAAVEINVLISLSPSLEILQHMAMQPTSCEADALTLSGVSVEA